MVAATGHCRLAVGQVGECGELQSPLLYKSLVLQGCQGQTRVVLLNGSGQPYVQVEIPHVLNRGTYW